jgi:hypothetical protein
VKAQLKSIQTGVRLCLIVAAVAWWGMVVNVCWTVPQPDGPSGRTIVFNCPTALAFITRTEQMLLYGLVAACLVLVATDIFIRLDRGD